MIRCALTVVLRPIETGSLAHHCIRVKEKTVCWPPPLAHTQRHELPAHVATRTTDHRAHTYAGRQTHTHTRIYTQMGRWTSTCAHLVQTGFSTPRAMHTHTHMHARTRARTRARHARTTRKCEQFTGTLILARARECMNMRMRVGKHACSGPAMLRHTTLLHQWLCGLKSHLEEEPASPSQMHCVECSHKVLA